MAVIYKITQDNQIYIGNTRRGRKGFKEYVRDNHSTPAKRIAGKRRKRKKDLWLSHLHLKGLSPKYEIIEECEFVDRFHKERYYMNLYKDKGFEMMNEIIYRATRSCLKKLEYSIQ